MEFTVTAKKTFDASHQEEFCSLGPRSHGHRWRVRATMQARFDLSKGRLNYDALDLNLLTLLGEIHGRHLNDMLPGTHTCPENIATWVMERLSLQHRLLFSVTVWQDADVSITVTREVRQ